MRPAKPNPYSPIPDVGLHGLNFLPPPCFGMSSLCVTERCCSLGFQAPSQLGVVWEGSSSGRFSLIRKKQTNPNFRFKKIA